LNDILGQECARVRITGESVSAEWIQVWTHTSDYRGQIERALSGSTFPRLSRKSLREMWVPVPAKDQQDRLVLAATRIDAALTEARRTVDDLEQLQSKQLDFELYKLLKEPT
jgi:restriction endonuclease S subunit